jgi:hypothetical protein
MTNTNYNEELARRERILSAEMGSTISRELLHRAQALSARLFTTPQHREDFVIRYLDQQYNAWLNEHKST